MATGQDIRAALDLSTENAPQFRAQPAQQLPATKEARKPQPRLYKKPNMRARGRAAKWSCAPSTVPSRNDLLELRRWQRVGDAKAPARPDFSRFNVHAAAPAYDAEVYEKHLSHPEWTKDETDYLMDQYGECNGKWPVIADHYDFTQGRSMEELKARFYSISAKLLELATPVSSMAAPDYNLHQTLVKFNPAQETSRKKLAEGHLHRRANEADEETVLLSELQRIMLNKAVAEEEREELRRRLEYPSGQTSGYQYTTAVQLTALWQQLMAQDRLKKNPRLRPTGNPSIDGMPIPTPTSTRPRESIVSTSTNAPPSALPAELSKPDLLRFGVFTQQEKLPSGVSFASDRLSKPRVAKSTVQTEKIAAVLTHISVPELIPLATPPIIEQFDAIMSKLHTLLDMRKMAEKDEQEIRVRSSEAGG